MTEIAVVGISCRLPGGIEDPESLWAALIAGRDLIGSVPPDRFDAGAFVDKNQQRPGRTYTGAGGFLERIEAFDADFFGIAPREASQVDPQQRLLLELTVEAIDDAAIDAAALAGSNTAVYVGISANDYGELQHSNPETISAYTNVGNALSVAANRISYVFDLHGPSLAVDTACSSGLVAVHQAVQSLRCGESAVAIAAGINVLLSPFPYVGFAKAKMLSPHGRCCTFGAGADGYVRAEGGGVVVLKPLASALADGDRVHAIIKGSAVNSDGRTAGLSLPNPQAQKALLRHVYESAGVSAKQLVYFEAHGTGTPAGDPIECRAAGEVLGVARGADDPLPIGSIKTNVGHLEPASGLAGLTKAILILRHREIPPSLHGSPPSPAIDFAGLNLMPVPERLACAHSGPLAVGVNSFGFGGTNAHVVLVSPPEPAFEPGPAERDGSRSGLRPILVSARSEAALRASAGRYAEALATSKAGTLYDLCYTACLRRTRHPHRFAALGKSMEELVEQLRAFASGTVPPRAAMEIALARGKVAFVYSGNGSQWCGMGRDLLAAEPRFRAAIERVDALLAPRLGWSVIDELQAAPERSRLARTEVAQPALFAVQLGISALLEDRGIVPGAVLGHSVGEVAAAFVAGAFDLETAARVIAERSGAQAVTRGTGKMAAVALSQDEAAAALARYRGALEISAVNSPIDVTVSGDADALAALERDLRPRGVFFRVLDLDYAFHSRKMDVIEADLRARLDGLVTREPRCTFVSTVTGEPLGATALDAEYWWQNIRAPVRFASAVEHLIAQGYDALVEIGPHAVLESYLRRLSGATSSAVVVSTLRRDAEGPAAIDEATARLIAAGAPITWERFFPERGRVRDLPAYPWQRERHWNGEPGWWSRSGEGGALEHPLLGRRLPSLEPAWQNAIERTRPSWIVDHGVAESVVVPATAYVEMALAAGSRALGAPVELLALDIPKALAIAENASPLVQISLSTEDGAFRVASRAEETGDWQLHAAGRVQRRLAADPPAALDLDALRSGLPRTISGEEHYAEMIGLGLAYGPRFRVLERIDLGADEAVARYRAASSTEYEVDPPLLDGALQIALPLRRSNGQAGLYLPSSMGRVRCWHAPQATGAVHARLRSASAREIVCDFTVCDDDGTVAVTVEECRFRRFETATSSAPERFVTVMRAAPDLLPPAEHPAFSPLQLARDAAPDIARLKKLCRTESHYRDYTPRADALCAHFAAAALAKLWPLETPFDIDALLGAGVAPRYARLLTALTVMVEEDGLAERIGSSAWRLTAAGEPERLFASMVWDFPYHVAELTLLSQCGGALADVLLDRVAPLTLIFPEGGAATAEHIYDSAPFARFHNALARTLVERIAAEAPPDAPLRILEIGAGTGGFTAGILPLLPSDRTRYVFTDISEAFVTRARERFARHDFVEYRRFDVELDAAGQGMDLASFDVVIAANVLHATADLRRTLRAAGSLVRPGGLLLGLEKHDQRSLTMTFGLLDGWWRFDDLDLRASSPLLAPARWSELLREAGFDEVALLDDAEPAGHAHDSLILARRRAAPLASPAPPRASGGALWILAVERGREGLSGAVAEVLRDAGAVAVRAFPADGPSPNDPDAVAIGFERRDEWRALIEAGAEAPVSVNLALLVDPDDEDAYASTTARSATIRAVAAALEMLPATVATTLWLVTDPSAALPSPDEPVALGAAALWGLSRSLANEIPRLNVRRLAFEVTPSHAADAVRVATELLTPGEEDEIVSTARGRFVPRIVRRTPRTKPAHGRAYALALQNQGSGYRLAWRAREPLSAAGPGQVAIAVRAVGLNYKDVLLATGRLSEEAVEEGYCGARPGMECSGIVEAVGPGVRNVKPGDRVYAIAQLSFSSHVVTRATIVGQMPDAMSFAEAATLATVFFTAHYALRTLARLKAGETILIHGAAGGVGLAAIQYARRAGAHIIATAGSPDKREFIRKLGVDHVLDSRSLQYAEQVMERTRGRGVDVIVNSLAGEAVRRNLDVLRPFGRMIELGKRDFFANARLGLRPFRKNVSFFGVDVDQMVTHEPAMTAELFAEMALEISAGAYRPLPLRSFPAERIDEAYRVLAHSRHIGKLVVELDDSVPVEPLPRPLRLDGEGTYLVTGGLGGFGARAAVWLAERGARRLALVGRRGSASPEFAATVAALANHGAEATAYAADVADADAMAAVLKAIEETGSPLRGVIHAAMVLDDAPLADLEPARFAAALAPKVRGGLVLDRITRGSPLDFFVAFSSATTAIGNLGQANYVAGNLFLEALVRRRRAEGLPGLAVAWGAIDDAGYLARHRGLAATVRELGVEAFTSNEALDALDELLAGDDDVVTVASFAWNRLRRMLPALARPRYARVSPQGGAADAGGKEELRRRFDELPAEEAASLVEEIVAELVAATFRIAPERLDRGRLLAELGLDSLMAVELSATIERRFGTQIPVIELNNVGSVRDLARFTSARLGFEPRPAALV